jgi:predicted dehydrogenase
MSADTIGVGFVGSGWISRAHAHALYALNHVAPLPKRIRLVAASSRTSANAERAGRELGFERWTDDWREIVDDPEVEVVAVLSAAEAHLEPTLAALAVGKSVLCEKPLGVDAAQSLELFEAAEEAGVTHACGFNYRYVPAVTLAHDLVHAGRLGELRHYRALYLQDYAVAGGQTRSSGGAGAVLDYSHLVDLLRWFAGEPRSVLAQTASFVSEVEDAYAAMLDLPDGAVATLEASRCALGWKGRHRVELNGSEGSLWWDMEDINRLHVFIAADEQEGIGGFRDVLVTQPDHPYLAEWWPSGHVLGWEHSFVHQWRDFLGAVLEGSPVPERQASFEDGYRASVLCEAILTSAREGRPVAIDEPAGALAGGHVRRHDQEGSA